MFCICMVFLVNGGKNNRTLLTVQYVNFLYFDMDNTIVLKYAFWNVLMESHIQIFAKQ